MKAISILGSTGSIGRQTLDIVKAHKEELKVVALASGMNNIELLTQQIENFSPELVCVPNSQAASLLDKRLKLSATKPDIVYGQEGLITAATHSQAQTIVTGVVGILGLLPTAAAIRHGKTIALANKETLVAAGAVIMPMAHQYGAKIVPVDSEHSAIFQSLAGHPSSKIRRLWLTGSGGPFRSWSTERMASATINDALKHPNWSMGKKITIDSATLMNKGLEIIEARWLFDVQADKIKVVIHPQSILHSAVEFVDGSIIGQMGLPDMRLPIHYALFFPERKESTQVPPLDLVKVHELTFEEPDFKRFPCLSLARNIAAEDNTLACVLNAANEIAVQAFLDEHITFAEIAEIVERVINSHAPVPKPSLNDILETDAWARKHCQELLGSLVTRT